MEVTLLDDFESTQLVTGGLGGLGLVTASALCAPWHGRRTASPSKGTERSPKWFGASLLEAMASICLILIGHISDPRCRLTSENHPNESGWWFGTFFIFHNIWDNPSH